MNDQRPKHRRFQFSLRTLLVVMLLVSIGMSWLAVKMQRARRQREAVEAIVNAGGYVGYASGYGPDDDPFSKPPSAPPWLRRLLGEHLFLDVSSVCLNGTQVTDAGLKQLKGLTKLARLDLCDTQVTDARVDELKKALPNCKIEH